MNQENLGAASISAACLTEMDHIYYAITIKPVLQDRTYWATDFTSIIRDRLRRFKISKQCWELDSKNVLHTHILASGPKDIKYKLIHLYGWHIHIVPIHTEKHKMDWEKYMMKEQNVDVLLKQSSMRYNLFDSEWIQ